MNRISATMKELAAEIIGDGNMFDKARQEKATASSKGVGLNPPPHAEPEPVTPAATIAAFKFNVSAKSAAALRNSRKPSGLGGLCGGSSP